MDGWMVGGWMDGCSGPTDIIVLSVVGELSR